MSESSVYQSDLHTHSTASDGLLTPSELVEQAVSLGLSTLALTDHDTVSGVEEAWATARRAGIAFIPGVELSTNYPEGECHILGYFLDYHSPALAEALHQFRESRLLRGQRMVNRLSALGLRVTWEQVVRLAQGGIVTRAHVAQALLDAGLIASRQEAFDRYIGLGGPAYVSRFKLSPEDAVRLIRQFHGVPVLAHPTYAAPERDWAADLTALIPWPFLERLKEAGLLGIEAHYGDYSEDLVSRLTSLAEHYGLIVTGGSDFHGHDHGPVLGHIPLPVDAVSHLFRLARECGSPWIDEFSLVV